MEEKKGKNEKWICAVIVLVIIILGTITLNLVDYQIKEAVSNKANKEVISINTIANEVMKSIKKRDEKSLDKYLAKGYVYIDKDNQRHNYIRDFWEDLEQNTTENYKMIKQGNSIKDEETYWIYWNIPEGETYQDAKQKIMIYFRKAEKEEEITYQIYQIILR